MGWGHSLQYYFQLTAAHRSLQSLGKAAIFCRNARMVQVMSRFLPSVGFILIKHYGDSSYA